MVGLAKACPNYSCLVFIMAMKMSRKRKASFRKCAEEMNEAKSQAKLVRTATTENTIEGPSTIVSSDSEDLPAPIAIDKGVIVVKTRITRER